MENHQALAAADVVGQGRLGTLAPAKLRLTAIVVADNDQIVGRQRLRATAAEFFRHPHLEASGIFQKRAQHRRGPSPIVTGGVLASQDQNLQFWGRRLGGRE